MTHRTSITGPNATAPAVARARALRIGFGLVPGGFAFWLAIRDVRVVELRAVLARAHLLWVLGATLVVIAIGVAIAALIRTVMTRERRTAGWALAGSVGAVALVGTAWLAVPADLHRAVEWIRFDPQQSWRIVTTNADRLPSFFEMFFRTFWLSAGWLRYPGPGWWHGLTVVLTIVAAAGLVLEGVPRRLKPALYTAPGKAVWLAAAMVLLQVTVVVAYYFGILQSGPQGRYLFPVLPAVFCLMWLGWSNVIGRHDHQSFAAVSLVAVMAFLDFTAWTLVILPAYA